MPTFAHNRRDINFILTVTTLLVEALYENLYSMSAAVWAALLVSIPWRWLPSFEVGPIARDVTPAPPSHAEHSPERIPLTPPPAAPHRTITLPDEVVVRAIDNSRSAFLACWRRALKNDPMLDATKVTIHLDVNPVGTVVGVTHDATNEKLGTCLTMVARGLSFSSPMDNATADFPLFFQPE
jgi:hypothetical protein